MKRLLKRIPGAFVLPLSLFACSGSEPAQLQLELLSGQPHMVTDGTALIEILHTGGGSPQLLVNDSPVSSNLMPSTAREGATVYHYVARDLPQGESRLTVLAGDAEASLSLVNWPRSGPVFSGEPLDPYLCLDALAPDADGAARRFAIGNGDFLDTDLLGSDCSLPTRFDYVYRSTESDDFRPLEDTTRHPDDLMMTQTSLGQQVPYIVRLETGTINRAIYQLALLHDPLAGDPSPTRPSVAWNGRLVYTFGGGCEAGFFQGTSTGGVLRDTMLSAGYAVASSTLNVNAQGGCNDVLSAETAMMVKEHFTVSHGAPVFTIGSGASGGAMQQLLIAGAYPGILDGLLPGMSFSDAVSYFVDSAECAGPLRRFANDPERGLDEATRASIGGWPNWYLCDESLGDRPDRVSPHDCPAVIPESARYHAQDNPDGIRCSIYDGMRNVFGLKSHPNPEVERMVARTPHDNVGVQYGLEALNAGLIDPDLFLDLNEEFGGWDIDGQWQPERMRADPEAVRAAYATGRVISGGSGLAQVPIIDSRLYLDDQGNFHASVYSFTTRARLERDNGHADNYVIRRHAPGMSLEAENLSLMDEWLTTLASQSAMAGSALDRIVAARPDELHDDCFDESGARIVEAAVFERDRLFDNTGSRCNALYPPHAGLRLVAGGPLANDVLQCNLKPLDPDDYAMELSDGQWQRLETIFPDGVCDWEQAGQHQQVNDTWLSFGPSPVNRYGAQAR